MSNGDLLQALPKKLEALAQNNLVTNENVLVRLKGAHQEALICTDRRVMILKSGLGTGHLFGSNTFQLPYENVASAEVRFGIITGYLAITTAGVLSTAKSYWSQDKHSNPRYAPNCISIGSRSQAASFRAAAGFILERIERSRRGPAERPPAQVASETDVAASLDRLWKLKTDGAIDQAEYEAAKARVLS
jgi:hypothetical protein